MVLTGYRNTQGLFKPRQEIEKEKEMFDITSFSQLISLKPLHVSDFWAEMYQKTIFTKPTPVT